MEFQYSEAYTCISRVSRQKGPTRHAYAWQIGPFWQDTLDMSMFLFASFNDELIRLP